MNNSIHRDWYNKIVLRINKIPRTFQVHRLVWIAFIPNSENKPQVNHINGIKTDNRVENLEWCTASENLKHSYDFLWRKSNLIWVRNFWKENPTSKSVNQYTLEWKFIKNWESITIAHHELWAPISSITNCCRWKQKTSYGFIWKYNN